MTWKTILYDYVHHRNQMDIDYSVDPMLPIVEDEAYLHDQTARLSRRAATDKDRHFMPVKSETRLTILRAAEREDRVMADVLLRRTSVARLATLLMKNNAWSRSA